ncbi:hypothetical protein [Parasutterella excrementihominis]|uniref:hypothetical protein n=1 Tax=Parasutterella excrementihominis TaxID=487175 RepID=UPI003522A16C
MSLKQNNNELSRLVGAAIAVLIALPIAAWVGSFIGDSYTARATAYILILAWSVLGAGILCFITRNSTKPVTNSLDHQCLGLADSAFGLLAKKIKPKVAQKKFRVRLREKDPIFIS